MSPLRCSTRHSLPTKKALEAPTSASYAGVQKRRSPRIASLQPGNQSATKKQTKRTIKLTLSLEDFVVHDSTNASSPDQDEEEDSDSDSDFDTDCPSSPDTEEFVDLSGDNVEYMAADDLVRRTSYDSRVEEGNEEYERDGFVVDDDEDSWVSDDDGESDGSEITITITQSLIHRRVDDEEDGDGDDEEKDRKSSIKSESSGLLVMDDDDEDYSASHSLHTHPKLDIGVVFKQLGEDVEPADVAEDIGAAVARFSRRCNRHCEPLRLELTVEMFGDREVADAMHLGVERGVGLCERMGDGKVRCIVGPKV